MTLDRVVGMFIRGVFSATGVKEVHWTGEEPDDFNTPWEDLHDSVRRRWANSGGLLRRGLRGIGFVDETLVGQLLKNHDDRVKEGMDGGSSALSVVNALRLVADRLKVSEPVSIEGGEEPRSKDVHSTVHRLSPCSRCGTTHGDSRRGGLCRACQ